LLLAVLVAVGAVAVANSNEECILIEYGGVVQPPEPRTTCDPPWAPSPMTTIMPEEAPPSVEPGATPDFEEGPSADPIPDNGGDDPEVGESQPATPLPPD